MYQGAKSDNGRSPSGRSLIEQEEINNSIKNIGLGQPKLFMNSASIW